MHNLILDTDSYKASHYLQYPKNTEYLSCYIESRGGKFESTLFFGLQMFLKKYFCRAITKENIDEAEKVIQAHGLPFNRADWEYILYQHNGFLPLYIEAVPEGTIIPNRNVLLQITNTDPRCYWLSTYLETALLRAIWYPTTVATLSYECKKIIKKYLLETADNLDRLDYMLADFGARGVSSYESAAIGGASHLINFYSTSTISALQCINNYYRADLKKYKTIPAAEHSTIISWGKDYEIDAYKNILATFSNYPTYAIVSDSYDYWNAINNIWGGSFKEHISSSHSTLIIRSDSGEPVEVVLKTIDTLMQKFGYKINQKGYKVLNKFIRVLHGDRISIDKIQEILEELKSKKISAENVSFGMGASLLQKINRDTQQFAMKLSAIKKQNCGWEGVCKSPITEPKKHSKHGKLALIKENNKFTTINYDAISTSKNLLIPVFKNGKIINEVTFSEIKKNVAEF
jgi:nicotinamide phosphoribosyltransferase